MRTKLYINIKIIFSTALIIMLMISCGLKQTTLSNTKIDEATPKLIFLNYTVKKTSNGQRGIALINKITTNGKLKIQSSNSNETAEIGDLKWNQLDKSSNVLQSEIIKNPLIKIFEFADDSKMLQTKRMELDSAQISLKLKLYPNTKYITITDIRDLKLEPITLIKTQIN